MVDWPARAARVQLAGQKIGEPYTYTPAGGAPFDRRAPAFSAAHEQVELEDGIAVSSFRPVLSVHLADFASEPAAGDLVAVRGVTYAVRDVQPDGEGDADLILGKP